MLVRTLTCLLAAHSKWESHEQAVVDEMPGGRGNPLTALEKSGYKITGLCDTIREGLSDIL